ncbi:MAG: SMP-30/gluconolactonase/LRE family protein [Limisphaerales bacterium]
MIRALFTILLLSILPAWAQDQVGTVAGAGGEIGSADGNGAMARFNDPSGLAVGSDGRIYLADSRNHVIRAIATNGVVSTLAGVAGEQGNLDGVDARFDHPSGLIILADGSLLVGDTGNHVIRRIAVDGTVATFAGLAGQADHLDGQASSARFSSPIGLAVDAAGNIFVADSGNHVIRRIDSSGNVSTFAGRPEEWGSENGTNATFNGPLDLAFDAAGHLLISDANNYSIRRVSPSGEVSVFAGQPGDDSRLGKPAELVITPAGVVYVADSLHHVIRRIDSNGSISIVSGSIGATGNVDGINGVARFFNPYGLALAIDGRLLISDAYNQTVRELIAPFALAVAPNGNSVEVSWESIPGRRYRLEQRADSATGNWMPLGAEVTASDSVTTVTLPLVGQAFLRVLRLP